MNWTKALNAFSSLATGYSRTKRELDDRREEEERWEQDYQLRKEAANREAERLRLEQEERIRKQKEDALRLSQMSMQNALLEKQLSYADADREFVESSRRLQNQKESILIEDARNRVSASRKELEHQRIIEENGYDAYMYMFQRMAGTDTKVPGQVVANSLAAAADASQRYGLPLSWTQQQAEAISSTIEASRPKAWKMSSYIDKDGTEVTYAVDEFGVKIESSEMDSNKLHPDVIKAYDAVVKDYTTGLNDFISNYSAAKGIYSASKGSVISLQPQQSTDPREVMSSVQDIFGAQVEQFEQRYGTFREMYDRKMTNVLPNKDTRDAVFDMMAPSFAHTVPMQERIMSAKEAVRETVEKLRQDPTISDEDVRSTVKGLIENRYSGLDKQLALDALNIAAPEIDVVQEDRGTRIMRRITHPKERWQTGPFEALKDWWKQHEKKKEIWESPFDRLRQVLEDRE